MAKQLVPDELWMIVGPLLPPEPPKSNGGRPRVPDRAALAGIIFVLKSGIAPEGIGLWQRGDVLEARRLSAFGGAARRSHASGAAG